MAERIEGRPIASPEDTLTIALSLAKLGWYVFPVKLVPVTDASGNKLGTDKRPLVPWLEGASRDLEQIATWWGSQFTGAWIGVHAERSGIVVADLDLSKPWPDSHPDPELRGREKGDGRDNLRRAGYELPKTPVKYKTRSGGRHYIYAAPEGRTLTIARDVPVPSVDVRAGNGLMVYYGRAIIGPVTLPPAPDWLLLDRQSSGTGSARAADGDIEHLMRRALPGEPAKPLRKLLRKTDWAQLGHDDMLQVVAELVKAAGTVGGRTALERARAAYIEGRERDRPRDWDNAVKGSIGRLGVPPATLELTKAERKHIAARNAPEAVEAKELQRKREYRVKKLDERADASAPDVGNRDLTDAALAEEIAAGLLGRWAVTEAMGVLRWTGKRWKRADEVALIEAVRRRLRVIRAEETRAAILRGDKKREDEARSIESRTRTVAITRFAAGILAERDDVPDAHPDLLNTPSGVVDLRTSRLMPHDPALMMTKMTAAPYDPKAKMGDWGTALEALPPKVAHWMQYRFGQSITGYMTDDDKLPFLRGSGDNGKSAVFNGVRTAVGDYAVTVGERLLLANPGDHPTELTVLMGARMAIIEELPEGRNLNVKRLKDTVGTPMMSARRMRSDPVEWPATHSLFLSTNYMPVVAETDHGTWKRLALVRFPYKFVTDPEPLTAGHHRRADHNLRDRLGEEPSAAALRWLVEGARLWYENGKQIPAPPKSVVRDTLAWRHDADPVLSFIDERLVHDKGYAVTTADLARDFNDYIEARGHRPWSQQTINARFDGHERMGDVTRVRVKFGRSLLPSRPQFAIGAIPPSTQAWRGVRFATTEAAAAERESNAFDDLAKRASQ